MTKQIYNEGRVVGLSSYEEYVRQLKAVDPEFPVCTEREWLAASLGMGSSMLLRVRPDNFTDDDEFPTYAQYDLPSNSLICAANTITGCYFYGTPHFNGNSDWADYVEDYGPLIANDSDASPEETTIPVTSNNTRVDEVNVKNGVNYSKSPIPGSSYNEPELELSKLERKRLMQYAKIIDGVVLQPGTWEETTLDGNPEKTLDPELKEDTGRPVVRINFISKPTEEFYILLTGFTNRSIIRGISKTDLGSVNTDNPENGDFLGPECFPWAAKIEFLANPITDFLLKNGLRRNSKALRIKSSEDDPDTLIESNSLLTLHTRYKNNVSREQLPNYATKPSGNFVADNVAKWTKDTGKRTIILSSDTGSDSNSVNSSSIEEKEKTIVTSGIGVLNKYEDTHGGFYEVDIDPYKMIAPFIEDMFEYQKENQDKFNQVYSDIQAINKRLDKIEGYITKIWNTIGGSGNNNIGKVIADFITKYVTGFNASYEDDNSPNIDDIDTSSGNPKILKINPTHSSLKVASGNINLYSGEEALVSNNGHGIYCHEPESSSHNNDIKAV